MDDVLLFAGTIFFVGMLAIAIRFYELRNECRHTWSDWVQSETEHAYVQRKICNKCGYALTHQFKKFKDQQ